MTIVKVRSQCGVLEWCYTVSVKSKAVSSLTRSLQLSRWCLTGLCWIPKWYRVSSAPPLSSPPVQSKAPGMSHWYVQICHHGYLYAPTYPTLSHTSGLSVTEELGRYVVSWKGSVEQLQLSSIIKAHGMPDSKHSNSLKKHRRQWYVHIRI